MIGLLAAVFVASLIGSLHCVGMCGPLMACAVMPSARPAAVELGRGFGVSARRHAWMVRLRMQSAYHLGRGVGYAGLGVAAGVVGALLNLGGFLAGAQHIAVLVAGGSLVLIGILALTNALGHGAWSPRVPARWAVGLRRLQAVATTLSPLPRAALIGISTALLPCGWLYAFVITAAGTGSAGWGALVMLVFWVGTLPLLAGLGLGLQSVFGRGGRRWRMAGAAAMVVVGLFTLAQRGALDVEAVAAATQRQAHDNPSSDVPNPEAPAACCPLGQLESVTPPTRPDGGRNQDAS